MKKKIQLLQRRQKEVVDLEENQRQLLSEELAVHAKLTAAKKLLHDSEIEQIQLLRHSWSLRKVDDSVSILNNLETGRRASTTSMTTSTIARASAISRRALVICPGYHSIAIF